MKYGGLLLGISIIFLLFTLVFTSWMFFRRTPSQLENVLKKNKIELYTNPGCRWCEKQHSELGELANHITVTECNSREDCPNIESFPTFIVDGHPYIGYKSKSELESIVKRHF